MQKRDYFERMIEQIAAAVAKVTGLARDAKLEEAEPFRWHSELLPVPIKRSRYFSK